jgi:hypothetical protein
MRRAPYELVAALVVIVLVTVWYVRLARDAVPQASGLIGHSLGILGFVLMLATETLYSLRKHWQGFHFGSMQNWLRWHVFMGLVGPFLVVLHSGWKFHGLAGLLTALTIVMVFSGFVGRYIYTAVPRTLDGVEVAAAELEQRITTADRELKALGVDPKGMAALSAASVAPSPWLAVLGRHWLRWRQRGRVRRALIGLAGADRARKVQLGKMLLARHDLLTRIQALAGVRRVLALWHALHVPLGGVVFTLAFVHVGAAIYYATLLKCRGEPCCVDFGSVRDSASCWPRSSSPSSWSARAAAASSAPAP